MARIVKKKIKKDKTLFWTIFLSVILFSFWCSWTVFINTYKTNIIRNIQECENRIEELKAENVKLQNDINSLTNKETVYNFAQTNNMNIDMNNIVNIKNPE